jgi:hypothetical protein
MDAVGVRCPDGDPTSTPDEQQPSQCCYALCPGPSAQACGKHPAPMPLCRIKPSPDAGVWSVALGASRSTVQLVGKRQNRVHKRLHRDHQGIPLG